MRRAARKASRDALETFLRASRQIRLRIELDLRSGDPDHLRTPQQLMTLLELSRGPETVGALAESMGVSAPTASAAVSTLEERGWLERSTDEADRRRTLIRLSGEGERVLCDMRGAAEAGLGSVLETLDDEEIARLGDGLAILGEALDRQSETSPAMGAEDDGRTRVTSG